MTVVPFRKRPEPPPQAPAIRFRVELAKGTHTRLFEIIPNVGGWQTWMRHDGKPLRAKLVHDGLSAKAIQSEYEREIAALLADGWTEHAR